MTETTHKQDAKRYSAVVRHQISGKSFAWCPEIEELIRFYTIDVDEPVEIGTIVDFEVEGLDSEGPYYASNVCVQTPQSEPTESPVFKTDELSAPTLHPAVDALRKLDIDSLSPIEALTKLYELKRMALK